MAYDNLACDLIGKKDITLGALTPLPRPEGVPAGESVELLELRFTGSPTTVTISTDGVTSITVDPAVPLPIRKHCTGAALTFPNIWIGGTGTVQVQYLCIRGYAN